MESIISDGQLSKQKLSPKKSMGNSSHLPHKQNQVGTVMLYGIPIVSLMIESQERLCLAQISNTLLKQYSYNEIHNRRVALGITCVQCTPVQLEILRRAGAMPVSSRRCGMITRREAERLCKSFLGDNAPPRLPDDFAFSVHHECAWGCRGAFLPSRYNSSRAKCIKCAFCDAANFNSWRRHMKLSGSPPDDVVHAWEDVKAMFNGGTRKRLLASSSSGGSPLAGRSSATSSSSVIGSSTTAKQMKIQQTTPVNSSYSASSNAPLAFPTSPRVPSFSDLSLPISMIDYVWHNGINSEGIKQFSFAPYAVPWLENPKRTVIENSISSSGSSQNGSFFQHLGSTNQPDKLYHQSAFRPVFPMLSGSDFHGLPELSERNVSYRKHISSEESPLPKKIHARDSEKIDNFDIYYIGKEIDYGKHQNVVSHIRCGSFDKENDLKKGSSLDVIRGTCKGNIASESAVNFGASGIRTTFKKELTSETYENISCDSSRQKGKVLDVSRLISLNTSDFDESLFKFRGFGSNFLEAISHLKTEERGRYLGITTTSCLSSDEPTISEQTEDTDSVVGKTLENRCVVESSKECKKHAKVSREENGEGSEDGGGDDKDGKINDSDTDGEETVDVETTDDPLPDSGPIPLIRKTLVVGQLPSHQPLFAYKNEERPMLEEHRLLVTRQNLGDFKVFAGKSGSSTFRFSMPHSNESFQR